ncbi:MAG: hypothetical protein ABEK59_02860 [Halobacteria archaeon]
MAQAKGWYQKNLKIPGRYDGFPAIDQFQYQSWLGFVRPIPQEPSGKPLRYDLLLEERTLLNDSPFFPGVFYTKEEIKKITFDHDEQINQVRDKYDIKNFLNVASFCNIAFSDWLNLTVYAKTALIYTYNEIQEQREAEQRRKETEQKLEMQQQLQQQNKKPPGQDSRNISIFK